MIIKEVKAFAFDLAAMRARRDAGRNDRSRSFLLSVAGPRTRGTHGALSGLQRTQVLRVNQVERHGLHRDRRRRQLRPGNLQLFRTPSSASSMVISPRTIEGENCMATDKIFDMLSRLATPYGSYGLASYAISAVDLALWDLKGKILERPVYELLGGPQKERIPCYATGYDSCLVSRIGIPSNQAAHALRPC